MRSFSIRVLALLALTVMPAVSRTAFAQGGPTMAVNKTNLVFGALTSGATFAAQTSQQTVRLTQTGAGTVTWVATPTQPWLAVSPSTGTGSANLRFSVTPNGSLPPSGTAAGAVNITYTGSATPSSTVTVTLRLTQSGTSLPPFGAVDTPVQNAVDIRGAIPVTGWALDDIEVARVGVCRAAVSGEAPGADGRCGNLAQIYIGDAVFIEGARPDVQTGYATFPRNSQAGWGLMVLTNMLPGQGNGPYTFYMWAQDVEGKQTLLGSRALTCDNAHATLPFGTIDTPAQGETISGSSYVNFGWALTQNPKYIPTDFASLTLYIDGSAIKAPSYGYYREDIATLFPGLMNSGAAVGYSVIDTTTLTNGLHTIVWTATDSGNFVEGLGSRYFTVANGSSATARTTLRSAATSAATASAPIPPAANGLLARRGWSPDAPWRTYPADASGVIVVHGQELDRFEWQVGAVAGEQVQGYLRVGNALQDLPVGSSLDAATGRFVWAPGVGFIGAYDLRFVRTRGGQVTGQQDVRVVLRPKTLGPQVVIDTPGPDAIVGQPFSVAGWAASLDGGDGTGIDTLHVWAYPAGGGAPVFLGVAASGVPRPDVAAAYGEDLADAGYQLTVQGLPAGDYHVAVFAWSHRQAGFLPAAVTRVHVR